MFSGKDEIQIDGDIVEKVPSDKELYLAKDNQGSDGSSDKIYTYSATYNTGGFTLYGGCEDKTEKLYIPKQLKLSGLN